MPYTKREPNRLYGNRYFNSGATFRPETPPSTPEVRNCTQYSADELIAVGTLLDLGRRESRQAHQDARTAVDNDVKTTDHESSLENNTTPAQSVFSSALPTSVSGSAASPPASLSDDDSDSSSNTVTDKPQPVLSKPSDLHNDLSTVRSSYTYAPSFASDETSELFIPEAAITDSHPSSSDHMFVSRTLDNHESKHDLSDESDRSTITVKIARQPLTNHEQQSLPPEQDSEMSNSSVVDTPSDTDFYYNNTTDDELQQVLLEEDARAEDMSDFAGSENTSDDNSDFSEPTARILAYSNHADDDDQSSEEFAEDTPSPGSHYDADSEMTDDTDEAY